MHYGGLFKVFFFIAIISLLLDWYVFSGLKTLTSGWKSALTGKMITFGYLAISVIITISFISGLGAFNTAQGMRPYHEYVFSLFITFLITKLFFAVILSLGDLGRLLYGIGDSVFGKKHRVNQPFFPGRRKFISELAVLIAAFPFFGFMYAMIRGKYDYKVHRQTIFFNNLPDAFDGFTITQISDIHSGSFDNTAAVQRGIDLAKAQKSDLFVLRATWLIMLPLR